MDTRASRERLGGGAWGSVRWPAERKRNWTSCCAGPPFRAPAGQARNAEAPTAPQLARLELSVGVAWDAGKFSFVLQEAVWKAALEAGYLS